MALQYRAAVLHAAQTPMSIETITASELKPNDVLVRIRAAGLCHTDLEVIEGALRYPLPIVLGHEAAGVVEQVGAAARGVKAGDHVVLTGTAFTATAMRRSFASNISVKGRRVLLSTGRRAPRSPTASNCGSSCFWARSANTAWCPTNRPFQCRKGFRSTAPA